ncbi:MAG TPA: hemin transporter [Verrucomicrobiales bacterium]|nr:hemin transporter [Verrucomicrobiales bacterium]
MDPLGTLYEMTGEQRLRGLVAAFYRRVRTDDLIGPLYPPDDWEGAEKRLADFLIYRFGGPQTYIEERGHPRLRGRHMPFAIGTAQRDRWVELMDAALKETVMPAQAAELMRPFFAQVADFMRNREG